MQKVSSEVYSPAEDSFLLEECVLKENLSGKSCLDLGTGSGILSTALLSSGAGKVLAIDINPFALKESKKRVTLFLKKMNSQFPGHLFGSWRCKKSDLFSSVKEKFDFIVFNPPYVPTDKIKWVDLDGGVNGRAVIDKFITQVPYHLNKKGVVLLLISSLNNPKEVKSVLKKKGFAVGVVGRKKLFFEELVVLRAVKI